MSILGHESPEMTMVYMRICDVEVLRDCRSVLEPRSVIAQAGAEAIRAGTPSAESVEWLRTNFLKTELELGDCLRLPSEGPGVESGITAGVGAGKSLPFQREPF